MDEMERWYENLTYNEAKNILQEKLENMKRDFIAAGYYLKYIRDHKQYLEDGYATIWEFAEDNYGIQMSTASRWMSMNDKFSQGGNSPMLANEFKQFGKSQLQEMLYLDENQIEAVVPKMTVKEIREVRKPEPTSFYGTAKTVYPEDSLMETKGCEGGHNCFCCGMQCNIRQEERNCVDAPLGNPFPCTTMNIYANLNQEVGVQCQFINLDLAFHRTGDGEPVPCCKNCTVPCGYECRHSVKARDEKLKAEGFAISQKDATEETERDITQNAAEADHFTSDIKTTDNVYGWARNEIVHEYLMTEYKEPTKECEIEVFGSTYKVLKRSGVTVFYNSSGKTLFDVENERLEQEYQFFKKQETDRTVTEPDESVSETGEAELDDAENEPDCTEIVSKDLYEELDELSDMEIAKEELDKANRMLSDMKKCFTENDKRVRKQKVLVAALAAFVSDLDDIINPPPEPELPEIPALRNNDQRKQFIDNYQEWPVWMETKDTREKYYRCDLSDGVSLVVKTYFHKCFNYSATGDNFENRYYDAWGNEEYYLLEEGKYFKDCMTNKSSLVDYLKEFQKGSK